MTKIVVLFGADGGIGTASRKILLDNGYRVVPLNQSQIDLASPTANARIHELLEETAPDLVINCAGLFSNNNNEPLDPMMSVNFGANWSIIKYYVNNKLSPKPVKIIIVGSSAYRSGKAGYMLYSASKAAVYNLWQGSKDYFIDSNITVDLLNPVRTRTQMTAWQTFKPDADYLEPLDVAEEILKLAKEEQPSQCVDMTFKELK